MPNNHGGARKGSGKSTKTKTVKEGSTQHLADLFGAIPPEEAQELWEAQRALAKGHYRDALVRTSGRKPAGMTEEEWETVRAGEKLCPCCEKKLEWIRIYDVPPDGEVLKYVTDRLIGKPVVANPEHPRPVFVLQSPVPGWGQKTYEVDHDPEPLEDETETPSSG